MKIIPLQLLPLVQNVSFTKGSSFRLYGTACWVTAVQRYSHLESGNWLCTATKPKVNAYQMKVSFSATGVLLMYIWTQFKTETTVCKLEWKSVNYTVQNYARDLILKHPYYHPVDVRFKKKITLSNLCQPWSTLVSMPLTLVWIREV